MDYPCPQKRSGERQGSDRITLALKNEVGNVNDQIALIPSAVPDRTEPTEHARRLLLVFDLEGDTFLIVGDGLREPLTDQFDVRLVQVHESTAADIYILEQFDELDAERDDAWYRIKTSAQHI